MKPGELPQFNEKWLKGARPKSVFFSDPGLDKKLKEFEVAQDLFEYERMLKILDAIGGLADRVADACKKFEKINSDNANTIKAMERYPALIAQMKTKVKKSQAKARTEAQKHAANGDAVPPQQMGSPVLLYKADLAKEIAQTYKGRWFDFSGYRIELKINSDLIKIMDKSGPGGTAFMVEDARDAVADAVKEISAKANEFGAVLDKHPRRAADFTDDLKKITDTTVAVLSRELDEIPKRRWAEFIQRKKAYKDYKIKTAKNIVIGTLGLAASGAAIAAAVPTGGATLAFGIVGAVRNTVGAVHLGYDLWQEAEDIEKDLNEAIKTLQKSYLSNVGNVGRGPAGAADKKSALVGAKEIGKGTLMAILGEDPPWIQTLPKCNRNYDLWQNKVGHLVVNHQKQTKHALKLLEETGKLQKEMQNYQNAFKSKEAGKILDDLRRLRKLIEAGLTSAEKLGERIRKAERALPICKKALSALDQANPDFAQVFNTFFPAVVNLALAGASAGAGIHAAKEAVETWDAAVSLVSDVATELQKHLS